VLVVDDDAGVQRMIKTMLEYEHFEVITANDGLEALVCLEDRPPDLILLDLTMPHMDGLSFVRELKQRGLRTALRIIILTADVYARPQVGCEQVDGWILKPFHLAELLGQIRGLLET
jgi:DNA-binding response OmpR family regulator